MKCRALGALDAVRRPQGLVAVSQGDTGIGFGVFMVVGEAHVIRRMPVLGQDHGVEIRHHGIDDRDHLVTIRHGQRPTRAKVVLHIYYNKGGITGLCHGDH